MLKECKTDRQTDRQAGGVSHRKRSDTKITPLRHTGKYICHKFALLHTKVHLSVSNDYHNKGLESSVFFLASILIVCPPSYPLLPPPSPPDSFFLFFFCVTFFFLSCFSLFFLFCYSLLNFCLPSSSSLILLSHSPSDASFHPDPDN
jgi:hypothetical protein